MAHLSINVASALEANAIICSGIIIMGKRVFGRKLVQEPRCCYKCQGIGVAHIAANCPQENSMCGRCVGSHRTAEYMVESPAESKHINCNAAGHAVRDRACPKFEAQHAKFIANNEANKYCFFLVGEDASMWEQLNEDVREVDEALMMGAHQRQRGEGEMSIEVKIQAGEGCHKLRMEAGMRMWRGNVRQQETDQRVHKGEPRKPKPPCLDGQCQHKHKG